jgi:uncharacterized RDD family membrane protein YckC
MIAGGVTEAAAETRCRAVAVLSRTHSSRASVTPRTVRRRQRLDDSLGAMTRHPWKRLSAWVIDWLCIAGFVAAVAALGIPLYLSGITSDVPALVSNVIATTVLVVPVTGALARFESSASSATPGKRLRRLTVVNSITRSRIGFGRALARNSLKIALPWVIGHAAVFAIVLASATSTVPTAVWLLTAIAYILPVAYVVSLFIGQGRTPYDRLCRTAVLTHSRDH